MNDDTLNTIYKSQKSTKEVVYKEIEGDFRSRNIYILTSTSSYAQPEALPRPSKNLWEEQICMFGLDMDHRHF